MSEKDNIQKLAMGLKELKENNPVKFYELKRIIEEMNFSENK